MKQEGQQAVLGESAEELAVIKSKLEEYQRETQQKEDLSKFGKVCNELQS